MEDEADILDRIIAARTDPDNDGEGGAKKTASKKKKRFA